MKSFLKADNKQNACTMETTVVWPVLSPAEPTLCNPATLVRVCLLSCT